MFSPSSGEFTNSYAASLSRRKASYAETPIQTESVARYTHISRADVKSKPRKGGIFTRISRLVSPLLRTFTAAAYFGYLYVCSDPKLTTCVATTIYGLLLTWRLLLDTSTHIGQRWTISYWLLHSLASCADAYITDDELILTYCIVRSLGFYALYLLISTYGTTIGSQQTTLAMPGEEDRVSLVTEPLTQSLSNVSLQLQSPAVQSPAYLPSNYMCSPMKGNESTPRSPIDELLIRKSTAEKLSEQKDDSLLIHPHIGNLDMTSTPAHEIRLNIDLPRPQQTILLNNNTAQNIIFAFKTNVPLRIKASPHSGILKSGDSCEIVISLARHEQTHVQELKHISSDSLAVEYMEIGDLDVFSRDFYMLEPRYKKRHCFRVFYA